MAPSGAATRGFGGHVAAIGLAAAYATVAADKRVHHAHVEFLRPTTAGRITRATVHDTSDGRTLARRVVEVGHPGEKPAAVAFATFLRRDPAGLDYQPGPITPPPTIDDTEVVHTSPVMVRAVPQPNGSALQKVWIRPRVVPLADDPRLHDCALLFASDLTVLWTTLTVHGRDLDERHSALATTSHSVWFHRDVDLGSWLLYDQEAVSTTHGLGQASGRMWTASGDLAATVMQVGTLGR
ncbi:acyl-CoA thioesterase [Phytohabitans suffuscus]|uniref:acyl-CoA thioesterase n=1 Tax=Phytohabitans suffuscus TaxID=624315 RepID=UPI0015665022|nr:acyl-CoA thioesterase domain-containing protein [Phytohabitans suffuscus]